MINFLKNTILFIEAAVKIVFMSKWWSKHKKYQTSNKEAIILANGPSAKKCFESQDFIERISEMDKLVVNHFCQADIFLELKPEYYIINAREFWENNVSEMYAESRLKTFNKLADVVDWEMILMLPYLARKHKFWQEIVEKNNNIKVVFYNITALEGAPILRNAYFNRKLGMPRLHNVLGPSIFNLIWFGYKKLYLVGVDHSWIPLVNVSEDNVAFVGQPHFYNTQAKPEVMYKPTGETRKLHEILHKFYVTFKGYFVVKGYAEKKGVEIVNLTEGSFIDAFDRQKLKDFENSSTEVNS